MMKHMAPLPNSTLIHLLTLLARPRRIGGDTSGKEGRRSKAVFESGTGCAGVRSLPEMGAMPTIMDKGRRKMATKASRQRGRVRDDDEGFEETRRASK